MVHKTRVHELAQRYGIESTELLRLLKDMGEFVKSSSSGLEPPVVARVEAQLGPTPGRPPTSAEQTLTRTLSSDTDGTPTPRTRPNPFLSLAELQPIRRRRDEWYRGDPPTGLTRYLLDHWVVPQRNPDDQPPKTQYFTHEVERAEKEAGQWATNLLDGWTYEDILDWAGSGVKPHQAVQIQAAGVTRDELGWHYEDQGRGDLAWRLGMRTWTVEQVINEAIARRDRA